MSYALQTLWHERSRYASGVLAVTFSAVLIALQCGLMLGLFKITSIPIDNTTADLWVGSTAVPSVDLGKPIPTSYLSRVQGTPGITSVELYIANFANFTKPVNPILATICGLAMQYAARSYARQGVAAARRVCVGEVTSRTLFQPRS